MEVPVINRIGDFEGGIASLQNPSVFSSRAFAATGIERIYQAYSFWKWGTLFLAVLVASFTNIFTRIRILLFRLHKRHPISSETLLVQEESDYDTESDFSDDDDDSDDEDDEEEEEEEKDEGSSTEEDFSFRGASNFGLRLRRRSSSIGDFFSWPEFASGTSSVVKMWDNFGLGLELNLNGGDQNSRCAEILGAPALIVSAEANMAGNLLRVWDSRVGRRIPQMLAEWRPKLGKMVGVNAGFLENVRGGELTVADMRKVSCSPVVGSVTESETADTWWDADVVNGIDDDDDQEESFMRRG
ncbi:hypothetical protein LINPERHAP1_LOCUS31539 [Linum perenne]